MKTQLLKYRGFVLGAVVSALMVSGAWATWSLMRPDEAGARIVKGNGRLDVQRIEIASKFAGQVLTVPVQEGDTVQAGEVIAQMDPSDYQAQLQGVQAMRQRATQAMARAQGEINVQRIKADVAQMDLNNVQDLRQQDLVSDSEVRKRRAQRDGEQNGVHIATAALGEAKAAQAEAEAGIKRLTQAIADHTLKAPVGGRIEYRVVEPGSVIPAGGRVATLLDTSHVYMTLFLPTLSAGQVQVGDEARIVLDAAPHTPLPAKVSFVSAEAQFTPKQVETSSEREKLTYRVKLALSAETALAHAGLIKAGMTGNGYVRLRAERDWPDQPPADAPNPGSRVSSLQW
ncbi:MAG: HlyD family efflux transporter periplasmic adaptor subunit [Burkholderiales bacterium]|nr:HlyD family efflux transporter periplasmic adaptor subunit [Burkholderiales bacterium]MDE2077793.1 HlyD family efflux transporter periplasmic adaptor subunit [Burkholderiales bacterium]MDE2433709.1 HlyD family efflux transporter periplasmic adaptor subunit [Burkholderiales bacterium]